MTKKSLYPNAFIIGVQKAGTTTLDYWLSQHPQIYCYDSLKDVHLFGQYTDEQINYKLSAEPARYEQQPVILQSAVNYLFFPKMLSAIKMHNPAAKLIVILRNPVDRAISAYIYFKKMLRENRSPEEAMLYQPGDTFEFSRDNCDFTYIEHGLYYRQLKECLKIFPREQVLVLDYADLATQPETLTKKIFGFLGIDAAFIPALIPKNVTGEIKNEWLQKGLVGQGKFKRFLIKYFLDFWFPRSKRKLLKQKIFELNTNKNTGRTHGSQPDDFTEIKKQLEPYFTEDARLLDELLGTDFSEKWFTKKYSEKLS